MLIAGIPCELVRCTAVSIDDPDVRVPSRERIERDRRAVVDSERAAASGALASGLGVDYSRLVGPAEAEIGWPLSAGIRSGFVTRGLNNSSGFDSSVDHAPSLGVRPNMQTGFTPKVEEALGHCRKPHMGTSAFRACEAAHLRLTFVGPVPSVHSGMQTW